MFVLRALPTHQAFQGGLALCYVDVVPRTECLCWRTFPFIWKGSISHPPKLICDHSRSMAHGDLCFKSPILDRDTASSGVSHCPFTWHGRDTQGAEVSLKCLLWPVWQHFHNFSQLQYWWHDFPALTAMASRSMKSGFFLSIEPYRTTATTQNTN